MDEIIEKIETIPFSLPMIGELRWGKAAGFGEAHHVLVKVYLKSGAIGYGEAMPRPTIYGETMASIEAIIQTELAPYLLGQKLNFDQAADIFNRVKNNQTAKGALNIALHGAAAQARGLSMADYLGCVRESVRVSYILGIGSLDRVLEEAQRVYAAGVRVFKVKIGRDWAADRQRLTQLRTMAGDVDLYVDANETMTADLAPGRLEALREMGVLYCEEPLPVENILERAALRRRDVMPLIADDSCISSADLKRELALKTFDILNIKCARTGYTQSLQMLDLARKHQKGVMVGSQAGSALGAIHHAYFSALPGVDYPSEISFFLKMKADITTHRPPIRDGYMAIEDLLTVEVDELALQARRLDGR